MTTSDATPRWLADLLGVDPTPREGDTATIGGARFVFRRGIWRDLELASEAQTQTSDAFGFKWAKRETFESAAASAQAARWLRERYGDADVAGWWNDYGDRPLLVDAGCGAAYSALALWDQRIDSVRYLGTDISTAVDVAAERFAEHHKHGAFLQADLTRLPLPDASVDVIFAEGVLHHTDSTHGALAALVRLLRPGGRILFYVYRRKGPVREFTDDYIRGKLQSMSEQEGWDALVPLTRLGEALGRLDAEIEIPEPIDVLEIPAGRITVQRLFYWHVCKAFFRDDYSIDEMNHINYDWFAPRNAHRQSADEVRTWITELGLTVEHETVEEAGITVIAKAPV